MLPDLLHGTLAEDEMVRVEAHVANCESCQEDLDVLRMVKSAAVFAPSIDVDRVVRQIPPYRAIVPAVEAPARTRVASWLVAATLALFIVGGGSMLVLAADLVIAGASASRVLLGGPGAGFKPLAAPLAFGIGLALEQSGATLATAVGVGIFETGQISRWQSHVQALEQQQMGSARSIAPITTTISV
jgi:predicted anti-sigma-YlaC factor YlaD